mmetsp:Transcript_52741/g.98741  ORF Transcript_52741/g.98741 Transcript_52741/m.98741 type:complete len:611 (+) Transcript_52741:20-1852(+)
MISPAFVPAKTPGGREVRAPTAVQSRQQTGPSHVSSHFDGRALLGVLCGGMGAHARRKCPRSGDRCYAALPPEQELDTDVEIAGDVAKLPAGWQEICGCPVFVPSSVPKRKIHFLGGAFVGASPKLFYSDFLAGLAEHCDAIVVATPYKLSFNYDSMASIASASFDEVVAELIKADAGVEGLPSVAVGHSCGALLHTVLAVSKSEHEACVLMAFNNKPVSDAIPVPLPPPPEDPTLRERLRAGIEGVLADGPVEEALASAAQVIRSAGAGSADKSDFSRTAPVLSQWGPLLGSVVEGETEFSPSAQDISSRIVTGYPATRTLVVQFANDFTDESDRLVDLIFQADGKVEKMRFAGGHTTPLDSPIGGSRSKTLATAVGDFVLQKPLPNPASVQEALSKTKDRFLRLSAGCNRGFSALQPGQRTDIMSCIEELEALKPDFRVKGSSEKSQEAFIAQLVGRWRLIWATSPDVLLLTSLPLTDCGEIRQDIDRAGPEKPLASLSIENSVELSPKGIGLLGVALPDLARAVTAVSKVQATGDVLPDDSVVLRLQSARLEPAMQTENMPSLPLILPSIALTSTEGSGIRLLTTFVDKEIRIARSPLGDVFVFARV